MKDFEEVDLLCLNDRELVVSKIAEKLYRRWCTYLSQGGNDAPYLGLARWRDAPYGAFWLYYWSDMERLAITVDEVEELIITRPDLFPLPICTTGRKNLFPSDLDIAANKYGGWHQILDPGFKPSEDFYFDFEKLGCERGELDAARKKDNRFRKGTLFYLAETLLSTWLDYLRGRLATIDSECPKFSGRFVDFDRLWFWTKQRSLMESLAITLDDIESLIAFCLYDLLPAKTELSQDDAQHEERIRQLADECRNLFDGSGGSGPEQPSDEPPGSGPTPAPVPLHPREPKDDSSVEIKLPSS
jgi:hypothetical protein